MLINNVAANIQIELIRNLMIFVTQITVIILELIHATNLDF